MKNPSYLALSRHQIYYFRFPIPFSLRPHYKPLEIRISLGTRCPKEALYMALGLAYLGKTLTSFPEISLMNYRFARSLLERHFRTELDSIKRDINTHGPLSYDALAHFNEQRKICEAASAENSNCFDAFHDELSHLIGQNILPRAREREGYILLLKEYSKARLGFMQAIIEHDAKHRKYDFSNDTSEHELPRIAVQEAVPHMLLKDKINTYIEEKTRLNQWTKKSSEGFRMQFDLLIEFLGDSASADISAHDATKVKDMLLHYPKRARTDPTYRNKTLKEILEITAALPNKEDKQLDPATIRKYISTYSSFYDWAVKRKEVTENYFKDINLQANKHESKRDAFTDEEMQEITAAIQSEPKEHYKWGALIGCFTGARLEEIAQLHVSDIKQRDNIWFFDINNNDGKKLKNSASKRITPLHSKLIEHGFLEYFEKTKAAGETRLLHALSYSGNNGYGRNLGRWFNDILLVNLSMKTKKLSFHSLRHTVITNLQRKGVEDSLIKRLIGHSQTDVTNTVYAKGQSLQQLKAAIDKL